MNNADEIYFAKRGWICPKCGNVLSPDLPFCPLCYIPTANKLNFDAHTMVKTLIEKEKENASRT